MSKFWCSSARRVSCLSAVTDARNKITYRLTPSSSKPADKPLQTMSVAWPQALPWWQRMNGEGEIELWSMHLNSKRA